MHPAEKLYQISISTLHAQSVPKAIEHFLRALYENLDLQEISHWVKDPTNNFFTDVRIAQNAPHLGLKPLLLESFFPTEPNFVVLRSKTKKFTNFIPENTPKKGALLLLKLDDSNYLVLFHPKDKPSVFEKAFLKKLAPLIQQFQIFLESLEKSEESKDLFYRQIVETVNEAVMVSNTEGKIVFVNEEACENLGYSAQELLQMHIQDIDPELKNKKAWQSYLKNLRQEDHIVKENISYRKDGTQFAVENNAQILQLHGQELVLSLSRDITERKATESLVLQKQNQLQSFVEAAPAAIAMFDQRFRFLAVSKRWKEDYGLADIDVNNQFFSKVLPDSASKWKAIFEKSLQGAILKESEEKVQLDNKQHIWIKWEVRPWYNVAQEIAGVIMYTEDISPQKRQAEELLIAKNNAEEASQAKEQFLANMSHEIRTPMNAILGMTRLLQKTGLSPKQEIYQDAIKASADNLLVIINDILDLSKIEAGKINMEIVGFDLNRLVNNLCNSIRYRADEKDVGLFYEVDRRISKILKGDPVRINQVLLNLVNNAIKFTNSNSGRGGRRGIVEIECRLVKENTHSNLIEFRVIDTGIGIDEDKLSTIFDSFSQGDEGISRKYGGTGLGLTISKRLVSMFGGDLKVKSKKSTGTTFYFTIELEIGSDQDLPGKKEKAQENVSLEGIKAILAEDNDINQFLVTTLLDEWGVEVDIAENGKEVLQKLNQKSYNLILMDIQMPIMGGVEATRIIRRTHKMDIPIIALTANAIKGDSERYINEGMDDYVSKPFEPIDLFNKIASVLERKGDIRLKKVQEPEQKLESVTSENPLIQNQPLLYNLEKLRSMLANDEMMVRKMAFMFLEKAPESLEEINIHYREGELDALGKAAHKLKSSIQLMGISSLHQSIRLIEKYASENQDHADLPFLLKELNETCESVFSQLKSEFGGIEEID